ncbi:MAG: DUF4340 domain-containing protein [Akkermansiaceae bacterium]|nr:DUF4340 domain-containing protein [Akkermansiaceae bacterium]MCP5546802.1 DUF4340 domain-containing protein [Akkermansiaceae bacterium]
MRSLGFTLLLVFAAAAACVLAGWQWSQGNLNSILGAPPTPVGERIYDSFRAEDVKHIRISTTGNRASFELTDDGWRALTPWNDRMDPRAATAIIGFTLGLRVEDSERLDKIDRTATGLGDTAVTVRLEDADHQPLAKYQLGRATPWMAEFEDQPDPVSTTYIHPLDSNRKRHVYIASGDINSAFKDNLRFLRDHHPFYFNPVLLQKVVIRSPQGDLTLGRETPRSPWRIVKPLDLATDKAAVRTLIEGIYELQAVKVSDRTAVTLPANDSVVKTAQIGIQSFGSETETLLDVYPPEAPEATEVHAVVSDRPDTVFDLPVKPEPGLVSLADLPLTVNELRDPTLTRLNIASLRGILIEPSTGPAITITREPPAPWMASVGDQTFEANEQNLYRLLKAVTETRAIGFESDAATDFSPWGLDKPILTLRFLAADNQALELRFGLDAGGQVFVNRLGTPTVMRVDRSILHEILVRAHEWRHARLWSVNRAHLIGIRRDTGDGEPLLLRYQFLDETWNAERDGKDLTGELDPTRANYLLGVLEGMNVSRWLGTEDDEAAEALMKPSLVLTVTEFVTDDEEEVTGVQDRTVAFAPSEAGDEPAFYFGKLDTEPHYFVIDRAMYRKISISPLDP